MTHLVYIMTDGDNSDEEEKEEPDVDKQMGDLEGQDGDKLDEQIWGDDDEENDKEESEVILRKTAVASCLIQ